MANGDRFFRGDVDASGEVASTAANIFVPLGFTPSAVTLYNTTGEVTLDWISSMPAASGYKSLGAGAFTFDPDLFSAATVSVVNDAGAAAKNPVYIKQNEIPENYSLGADVFPSGGQRPVNGTGITDSSATRTLYVEAGCVTEYDINIVDAAAGAGDSQVFFRPNSIPSKGPILGKFVSNNAATANGFFTVVNTAGGAATESVPVYFDTNAAEDSYVVSVTAANPTGSRIVVQAQFAQNCYAQTQSGRYISLPNGALVAGTELFFDDNGADTRLRLKSNIGGGDITNLILNLNGDLDVSLVQKYLLFVKPAVTANTYTFRAAILGLTNGTIVYLRMGDRVVPVQVDSAANTGTQVFWDQSVASTSRLRAVLGANGTVALARDAKPNGYNTTGTISGAAGNVAFITVGGITSGNSGFQIGTDADVNPAGAQVIKWVAWR